MHDDCMKIGSWIRLHGHAGVQRELVRSID